MQNKLFTTRFVIVDFVFITIRWRVLLVFFISRMLVSVSFADSRFLPMEPHGVSRGHRGRYRGNALAVGCHWFVIKRFSRTNLSGVELVGD